MASLSHDAHTGVFHFAPPQREVASLGHTRIPTLREYELGYQAIFYASEDFHDALGGMPLTEFVQSVGDINFFLHGTPRRGSLQWHPGDPQDTIPYQWFFLTCGGAAHQALWRTVEDRHENIVMPRAHSIQDSRTCRLPARLVCACYLM
jgi:hypothetical protein